MKVSADIDVTPQLLAEAFTDMVDEDQAQFFIEVAEIAKGWTECNMDQWYAVGMHLRTCSCSTNEARDMVQRIARGMQGP